MRRAAGAILVAALLLLSPAASGGPVVAVNPSGGDDAPNLQAAINAVKAQGNGAVQLCGSYKISFGVILGRNVAVQGCGTAGCRIDYMNGNLIAFGFIFSPGDSLSPGYFDVSGCILNAGGLPNTAGFLIWTFGDYRDVTQVIYGINLRQIEIWNPTAIAMQIGRSMGTTLDDVYIKGGLNGVYCFDCGELYVSNLRAENSEGFVLLIDGTGNPDDHWAEGAHLDKVIGNGTGYGLMVRNYGWLTATNLDLTTMRHGPGLWLLCSVANVNIAASQFSGNNGFGGLSPQPGVLFDRSCPPGMPPQPLGPHQRITISSSQISNSSIGAQVNGVANTLNDVKFTANNGSDLVIDGGFDSTFITIRADSGANPNIVDRNGGNNLISGSVTRSPVQVLSPGTIVRDARPVTR